MRTGASAGGEGLVDGLQPDELERRPRLLGTSSSPGVAGGSMTVLMPASMAASTFSLWPTAGPARQADLAGHREVAAHGAVVTSEPGR